MQIHGQNNTKIMDVNRLRLLRRRPRMPHVRTAYAFFALAMAKRPIAGRRPTNGRK